MFNYIYDRLSNKVGEDCSMNILEMVGFAPINFDPEVIKGKYNSWLNNYIKYKYPLDDKLRSLIDKYNKMIDNREGVENQYAIFITEYDTLENIQKKIRNIIFRYNIKIYDIKSVIYDKKLNRNQVPMGRSFEKRPIFKGYKRVQYLSFNKYNGDYYLVINFTDKKIVDHKISFNYERIH